MTAARLALVACGLCGVATAQAPVPPTATAFLADPLLAPVRASNQVWPTRIGSLDVWVMTLRGDGHQSGQLVVHQESRLVVSFSPPRPVGPLPATEQTQAEAEPTARAFAARWAREVFAPGGEVLVERCATLAARGYWLFRFRRVVRQIEQPLWAQVGVRGCDGTVAFWRRSPPPVLPEALLPTRTISAEQAVQRAREVAARDRVEVTGWLPPVAELRHSAEGGPRVVWVVAGECRPPGLLRVEVADGDRVHSDLAWDAEVEGWYRARGGQALPPAPTELRFADQRPVPTPDGRRVLFRSTRSRPGHPAWCASPPGLCIVDLDGRNLRTVVPAAHAAALSPDGGSVAWSLGRQVFCRRLDEPTSRLLWTAPVPTAYTGGAAVPALAWSPAGVVVWCQDTLLLLDPVTPGAPLRRLADPPQRAGQLLDLGTDGRGNVVILCAHGGHADGPHNTDYSLWLLATSRPDALVEQLAPRCGCDRMPAFVDGRAVFSGVRGGQWLVDTRVGSLTEWLGPTGTGDERPWGPTTGYTSLMPDGQAVVVTRPAANERTVLLWWQPLAGGAARPLTTESGAEVPLL